MYKIVNTPTQVSTSILTFGNFDILLDGNSVFKKVGRKYKNLELLKFFITNKNKRIVPEHIIDYFWSDKDYGDPKNALSTQVHRLKKTLIDLDLMMPGANESKSYHFELQFINGFYIFSTGKNCSVDVDIFVDKIMAAESIKKENPEEAINTYREIIEIYKGQYMEENAYSEWAVNVRNNYHRMYIQSVIQLLELLKYYGRYTEVVDIFSDVVIMEQHEERFHVYFLEALAELKEYRYALSHYNYVTTKMYKDIGVRPSSSLQKIYRKILRELDFNEEVDAFLIDKKLTDDELSEGSIFCEVDYFKFVYNLEKRLNYRYDRNSILTIVTLRKKSQVSSEQIDKAIEILRDILWISLRKSDLVTKWNNNQILVLLIDIKEKHFKIVTRRIEQEFKNNINNDLFDIEITHRNIYTEKD